MCCFAHLLESPADPESEDHQELTEWVEWMRPGFDSEAFVAGDVAFEDPAERLAALLDPGE